MSSSPRTIRRPPRRALRRLPDPGAGRTRPEAAPVTSPQSGKGGSMATTLPKASSALDKISYEILYERWEKGNWRSTEIDFSEDRTQWHERFSDLERRAALWNYAMFFHGEDSVADNLSPYIDAAPREEQKYFLATQQADEARHAVFFGRFMKEVVGTGDTIGASLEATRPELTWGFRKVFARLDRMADELRRDCSRPKLAQGITLYHMIIESTLARPGQHFIDSYLDKRDLLPGFRSGMKHVSLDEQRHIAFGVKLLSDLVKEDPECRDAVAELLREVVPYAVGVFVPPNWDERYAECFGFTLEEIYAEGFQSFRTKMQTAGLPLEEMPGVLPLPSESTPQELAARILSMLRANLLGEKNGAPRKDPEAMAMLFETIEHAVDTRHSPERPATIQWDFRDAEPWHLRIDNGSTRAEPGRREDPDLTFRCRFEDWVDVVAGRVDPRKAVVTGRLRPRAKPRALWRARGLFTGA
jgi:ribonucleotide reductase beta subunit family protein with ferritin-like domain